jgi:hypothetical protein
VHLSPRSVLVPVVTILAGLMLPASPALAQSGAPAPPARSNAAPVTAPPLSEQCTTTGHSDPCAALTTNAADGGPFGCDDAIPLFSGATVIACLPEHVWAVKGCHYSGYPVVAGDSQQDHIVGIFGDPITVTGHIPHHFIPDGDPPSCHQ